MTSHRTRNLGTVAEAATRYRVSEHTIRRGVWDGRIPSTRVGRQIRLDFDALDELFDRPATVPMVDGDGLSETRVQRVN